MQISAPVYRLKRQAKRLAREAGMPLHVALDKTAAEEGFQSWSHLASAASKNSAAREVLSQLAPGDLVLLAARPGHGKTLLGLELAARASERGLKGSFFTLDYHEQDIAERLRALGVDAITMQKDLLVDTSDEISAQYIIGRLSTEVAPMLIVIDYLQLLDQKRSNPSLNEQLKSLHSNVQESGAICAVISQVDRRFDLSLKQMPSLSDIRMPNPFDLSLFSKVLFLHDGKITMDQAA